MLIEIDGKRPRVAPGAFVAPTATLIGDVEVAERASIWFGAVLRGDVGKITIGPGTSIQDNAVIHADRGKEVNVEGDVVVAHGVVLHSCTIKRGAVIGIRSVVLDEAVVGEEAMIGAGSVVKPGAQIPPRHLATGVPARVKKELGGDSLWWVQQGAHDYQQITETYLRQGIDKLGR